LLEGRGEDALSEKKSGKFWMKKFLACAFYKWSGGSLHKKAFLWVKRKNLSYPWAGQAIH